MTFWDRVKSSFMWTLGAGSVFLGLFCLGLLLWDVIHVGLPGLSGEFLSSYPSRFPAKAGLMSALVGTLWVMGLTALISIPLGVSTAIYLEEYAANNKLNRFIKTNLSNLAGVPSIVYGILGLALFVRAFGMGRSILAGALTMSLLILPVLVIAASEALKAVPQTLRLGAYAVGATRWEVTWYHVLPEAAPGVLTGIILALSRALGESAPLIMIGALSFVAFTPEDVHSSFTVLAIQIYNWAGRPQPEFHAIAASGIIVLLGLVLMMNAIAIVLRLKMMRSRSASR